MSKTTVRKRPKASRPGRHEAGMAIVWVLFLVLIAAVLTGALVSLMMGGMNSSSLARHSESAYELSQAGINSTLFQISAATDPSSGAISIETYLANNLGTALTGSPRSGSKAFTGTLTNGTYRVTLSDPSAGDGMFELSSVGTDASGKTRNLVAYVEAQPVVALGYAMFGNQINFHNHNNQTYAVTLNTSMFSNSSILIDRGISIIGPAQAVNAIEPNTGGASSSMPNTILCGSALVGGVCTNPSAQQGNSNPMTSDTAAPVTQGVPGPAVQPFPTFAFASAAATASAAGRELTPTQLTTLISNAQTYAAAQPAAGTPVTLPSSSYPSGVTAANVPVQVIHYKTSAANPDPRNIAVPNGSNASAYVPLGSPSSATSEPTNAANNTDLYEVDLIGNPLSDTVLYVTGDIDFKYATNTLIQVQGSIIADGSVGVHAPMEILAWDNRTGADFVPLGSSLYTDSSGNSTVATTTAEAAAGQPYDVVYSHWPAIAANGPIKVDDSGSGYGGPVHIEGTMYSVAESHIHKSNPYESTYAVGSEIADSVHNCQWFSFAYDPMAKTTLGFYNQAAGRVQLNVIRLEDHH